MLDNFIKTYAPDSLGKSYRHTALVSHSGTVIAFALDSEQQFWYTVLDLENGQIESPIDVNYWFKEPVPVPFPKEIAQVGYSIAGNQTIPDPTAQTLTDGTVEVKPDKEKTLAEKFLASTARLTADAPFQVMSDGQYVYIFRQAIAADHPRTVKAGDVPIVNSTLLVDRFVFAGTELKPKLEVRYQRSRSKDRPLNRKDSLASKDLERNPFYEPTQELDMVRNLIEGRFAVALLPTAIPNIKRWQIFAHNSRTGLVDSFNIERSKDGLFNPRGTQFYTCDTHPEVFEAMPGSCPECASDLVPKATKEGFAESALKFNGKDTWIKTNLQDLSGSALTIEFWFKGDELESAVRQQHPKQSEAIGMSWGRQWTLPNDGGHKKGLEISEESIDGNWHHIAMTWQQGTENGFVSYLDGRITAQRNSADAPLPKINAHVDLGAVNGKGLAQGTFDEIRIWNRARSRSELKADMHQRLIGHEDGLVAYWRFDEGRGKTVHDQTDNAYHGTIHGQAGWVNSDAPVGDNPGVSRNSFEIDGRAVAGGLSALLYHQQEKVASGYSQEPKPLKKNARLMLATVTQEANDNQKFVAILDFALSRQGKLTLVPDTLMLPVIGKDETACSINEALDRRSSLEVDITRLNTRISELTQRIEQLVAASKNWDREVQRIDNAIKTKRAFIAQEKDFLELKKYAQDNLRGYSEFKCEVYQHAICLYRIPLNIGVSDDPFSYCVELNGIPVFAKSPVDVWARGLDVEIKAQTWWGEFQVNAKERSSALAYHADHGTSQIDLKISLNATFASLYSAYQVNFNQASRNLRKLPQVRTELAALEQEKANLEHDRVNFPTTLKHNQQELEARKLELAQKQAERQALCDNQLGEVRIPMELLHTDRFGLTLSGGVLSFAYTSDTPTLFDSATGKLGLYFRGATGDQFFAAYFDTLTERVVHTLEADTGQAVLEARNTERAMDQTTITVADGSSADTCTLTFHNAATQLTETWVNLPRRIRTFTEILNGNAVSPRPAQTSIGEVDEASVAEVEPDVGAAVQTAQPLDEAQRQQMLDRLMEIHPDNEAVCNQVQHLKAMDPNDTDYQTALDNLLADVSALNTADSSNAAGTIEDEEPPLDQAIYYDYSQVELSQTDKSIENGSLFFVVKPGSAQGFIQNTDEPIELRQVNTRVNEWVADAQGNVLYLDGEQALATRAESVPLDKFDVTSDVSLETWVNPSMAGDGNHLRLINHSSDKSRYLLGLNGTMPGQALAFNGENTWVETGLKDLSGSALTIEYWFKGESLKSAVRQQSGNNYIIAGWTTSKPAPKNYFEYPSHSVQFDGSKDCIRLPKNSIAEGNEVTVMFWAKGGKKNPASSSVITAWNIHDHKVLNVFLPWNDGVVYFDCGIHHNVPADRISKRAEPSVYKNRWTHWAFTKNAATGEMKIYQDGALWHQSSNHRGAINQLNKVYVGSTHTQARFYDGNIAELSIWNKECSQAEIQSNMNRHLSGQEAGLWSYYPLDEIKNEGGTRKVLDLAGDRHGEVLGNAVVIEHRAPESSVQGQVLEDAFHAFSTDRGVDKGLPIQRYVTDGRWHHVAMTWQQDTENGFVSYLDGEIVGQRSSSATPIPNLKTSVLLGSYLGKGSFLQGALAEVRIWNVARSQSQIRADMHRPIRDAMPGLLACWSLMDGDVKDYSGNKYHGKIHGKLTTTNDYPLEAVHVVAGVGNQYVQTEQAMYLGGWMHLASAFSQSFALQFDGIDDYLMAPHADNLNLTQELTIEAFIQTNVGREQGIITKGRIDDGGNQDVPYALSIAADGRLIFAFERTDHVKEYCVSESVIPDGKFCKVAVTRTQGSDRDEKKVKKRIGGQEIEVIESVEVNQWQDVRFFIDGQVAGYRRYNEIKPGTTSQPLEIGKAYRGGGYPAFFKGVISEVRLWNRAVGASDLGKEIKGLEQGLAVWWQFEENEGNIAFDTKGSNHCDRIGARWVKNPDPQGSSFFLYVNGISQKTKPVDAVPHGDQEFTLGGYYHEGVPQNLFQGSLEETRIWRVPRTQEQIQDNMFRRLLGERKELLAYYQFDADLENRLSDSSGRAHHLTVINPDWQISNAPVSYETPQVRSALAGVSTAFQGQIQSRPAIQEYGDMQYNDDNELIGVMKRCYAYIKDDEWHLITGFKIGNVTTEWVGQAQYDPQIIGFIEGAPPVPSENCTEDADDEYSGGSAVEIIEADSVQYTLAASQESTMDTAFGMSVSAGGSIGLETVLAPLGAGISQEITSVDVEAALEGSIETSNGWSGESSVSSGKNVAKNTRVTAMGTWESDSEILNATIGKRFVFNNVGFALVQSDTADIYALRMEHNQALVAFRFQPNPDIPKDWNLVSFQMNPRYVCQGTLDGRVGMNEQGNVYDPNYANAHDYGEYSYFKPREAYLLKNRIRQAEEELKTYYENFSTSPLHGTDIGAKAGAIAGSVLGSTVGNLGMTIGDLANSLPGDSDLPQKLAKRNLVNTYVWTADGGFFAETTELTEAMSETSGGSFSLAGAAGGVLGVSTEIIGISLGMEMSASLGGSLNLTKTKTKDSEKSFGLEVELEVPSNIQKYLDGEPVYDAEGKPELQPGKVDAYRFMTFYMEPDVQNFDMFVNKVVDPIWLQESKHPNAAALRSALKTQQKANKDTEKSVPWRVMHRVTFVSRVLPEITPDQVPQTPEQTIKAAAIDSNYELIKRLEPFVSDKVDDYARFTDAVRQTIDAYIPELKPAKDYIVEYMCQYYQVFE
mgnify:CR=1 FL=1